MNVVTASTCLAKWKHVGRIVRRERGGYFLEAPSFTDVEIPFVAFHDGDANCVEKLLRDPCNKLL